MTKEITQGKQSAAPKKIIRKIAIKKQSDEQIAKWKPTKIIVAPKEEQKVTEGKKDIASSFLSALPKPRQEPVVIPQISWNKRPKIIVKMQPTEQQRKWDIEDETFIRKQFTHVPKVQNQLKDQDDDAVIERVQFLNDKKVKQIDMIKIIDNNWKQTQSKNKLQEDIYQSMEVSGKLGNAWTEHEKDKKKFNMRSQYGW